MLYLPEENVFLNFIASESLRLELNQIYTDLLNLHYFEQYGTYCVVMAAVLGKILANAGYRTRMLSCYAKLRAGRNTFLLGYKDISAPGQIDGHAVCVVNDQYLLDFGLGNARKYFSQQIPWAIAAPVTESSDQLAQVVLQKDVSISWRTDWSSPAVMQEASQLAPHLNSLLQKYYSLQAQRHSNSALLKKTA